MQNYPAWDEGWLTVVRHRIQMEDEVVEDLAELGLEGVEAESQVREGGGEGRWAWGMRYISS